MNVLGLLHGVLEKPASSFMMVHKNKVLHLPRLITTTYVCSVTRRFLKKLPSIVQKVAQNVSLRNKIFYPKKLLFKLWEFEYKKYPKSRSYLGEFTSLFRKKCARWKKICLNGKNSPDLVTLLVRRLSWESFGGKKPVNPLI
jgi:hypothetical protein